MNLFEKQSISTYNRKADYYDDTFDGRFTYPYKVKLLETIHLPQSGSLLDVACGNGKFLQMLSNKQRFQGYGCDISANMVRNAKQSNPQMTFAEAACDALPFEDEHFDVVTVCAAFHHFPDISAFAKEALRVLKPGGWLYIAEVYFPLPIRIICNPFVGLLQAGDVKFYGPKEITRLLKATGYITPTVTIDRNIQIIQGQKTGAF